MDCMIFKGPFQIKDFHNYMIIFISTHLEVFQKAKYQEAK